MLVVHGNGVDNKLIPKEGVVRTSGGCVVKLLRQWGIIFHVKLETALSGFDADVPRTLLCAIPNSSAEYRRIADMIPNREPHPLCDHAPPLHAFFSCGSCVLDALPWASLPFCPRLSFERFLRRWHGRSKDPFLRLTLLSPQRCSKPLQFIFEVIYPALIVQTNSQPFTAMVPAIAEDQFP